MDDDTRKPVLGEALLDELKAIRENTDEIPAMKLKIHSMDDRLEVVETDVKVIKAAVRDISQKLNTVQNQVNTHELKFLKHRPA